MKAIELALQSVEGYLISISRNPMNGWYEIEIGLPSTWAFDENDKIKCEILNKTDVGNLIKLSPKNSEIIIDDLINFLNIIIDTNKKIAEKELEFKQQMDEMKRGLEKKASEYFKELDELKENSFKTLNDSFIKTLSEDKKLKKNTKANNTDTAIDKNVNILE